jgi:dipeptidyl aminopeptidase/acylaminoacyl peptidase
MHLFVLALCFAATFLASAAGAEPIPTVDFFRPSDISNPVVSPSGKYVAASMAGGSEQRQRLVILNLEDIAKSRVIAGYTNADIVAVHWVNDNRLVFSITDNEAAGADQRGAGLFAIDREGSSNIRRLIKNDFIPTFRVMKVLDRELSPQYHLFSTLQDGSNDVVVRQVVYDDIGEPQRVALWRLDTTSGIVVPMSADAPEHAFGWALDPQGVPRVTRTSQNGKSGLYWRASAGAAWSMVDESNTFTGEGRALTPLKMGENDILYASANEPGTDTSALVKVDMHKPVSERQSLVYLKDYDFDGSLVFDGQGKLLGVRYLTDARGVLWLDPRLKKIQERVDALLPATINSIDCGLCADPTTVFVSSWSDRQPALFELYDAAHDSLTLIGASRPWIKPKDMAAQDMLRFTARDGLVIPVHVTRPAGQKGAAPAVVLVHGGPWVRGGEWEWDADAQFLASRGYVVIKPEFRGSTGFGFGHFRASWRQWGLAMQDDVTDATDWAVKQGYADPKRICIAGASYGGYAVLMGLIRYPDEYRCGVEWVGVTDIDLLYTSQWNDFSDQYRQFGMPTLVGDRKADAAQLAATSPLQQAGKITKPLLMAYGGIDRRVPIEHGNKLRSAMRDHGLNPEWIAYQDEGHGWMLTANKVDFWNRVDRFLASNLAPAP